VSLRTRVVLVALVGAVLPLGGLAWWSTTELREMARQDQARALERQARMLSLTVGDRAPSDSLADRLGETTGVRVTFVGPDGRVQGDSRVPAARIPALEAYDDRPEIRTALAGEIGRDQRLSQVAGRRLLFVAVPHGNGVIRAAVPLEEATAVADHATRVVAIVAAGGILFLILAGGLLEAVVTGPIRRIREDAEAVAAGDLSRRHRGGRGEAGELARALDGMVDRLEAAEEQRDRAREIEELFDRLDEGVALVDREGTVRRTNRAFRGWIGRPEAAGTRFETLFRDPQVGEALEEALDGEAASRETRLGERTALVSLRPHPDGAVAVLRDLTRLRRLEGVRRDFVANVSHELKTPLTSVLGFAEPLTDPEIPREQQVEFAERIVANGTRMRRLIDELLDLSRIEAGAWEPDAEEVEVTSLARAVWRELAPRPEDRAVELELEEGPPVTADPEALRQILRNLLDNALRYAPDGSAIRVSVGREDGTSRIAVTDRGPGIPEQHRERIFERFYRADSGRAREDGGTGLGLSIVKHMVAAHGGEVGVESEVGEGTTVWIRLPAGPEPEG
jgi:two-component system phosphate regulon sensor histidine kinase PhoR